MDDIKKRLVHLHHCRGIGWKTIYHFLKYDSSLQSIYQLTFEQLLKIFPMKKENANKFYQDLHSVKMHEIISYLDENKIVPITYIDECYPKALKQIYDPPWVLYCKGNLSLLHEQNMIAIIGTRTPSPYSLQCLKLLIPPLIKEKYTIVSGLALGVDALAHKVSMEEKGHTIGVLGSGFNHMYPNKNKYLADKMSKEQLVLSEYPPHISAKKWHFPMRNRIISGLSKGVLIIEAKEKSGSLITADQALEQGRDVFVVPGSIFSELSKGCNHLIQQGAKLVMSAEDIFEEWNGS